MNNIENEIQKIESSIEKLSDPNTPLDESSKIFKATIKQIDEMKKYLEQEQEQIQKIIEVDE